MIARILEYGKLVRFSHTLFALPFALASMVVAAGGLPPWHVLLLILGCMATARNGAMAFNRLADARFDALNPRTAKRHLASGTLAKSNVVWFIVGNGVLFVVFAGLLNPLALICSVPVFLFLLSYSLWKRFSWLCHWFLGVAVGMSPLGAWIAVQGSFAAFPVLMGVVLALWMGGFDIIYSTQDEMVDRELGLHSVPARFGRKVALRIALASHVAMLGAAWCLGYVFHMGLSWWIPYGLMVSALAYIHFFRTSDDLDSLNRDFFLANVGISLVVFVGMVAWIATGGGLDGFMA